MGLPEIHRCVRLVKFARGEMSDMELPQISSTVRLIAASSPVKSVMLAFSASTSTIKFAISAVVIVSPDALPSASSILARRLSSGIFTPSATTASNRTSTPLRWRSGMWVLMEAWLRGFPRRSTLSSLPNPVFATRGERSEMELSLRNRNLRLVNPSNAEILEMLLPSSPSPLRLVNPATAEISGMELPTRSSPLRLVNPVTAEMSEMVLLLRYSSVRLVKPATAEISEMELPLRSSVVRLVKLLTAEISEMALLLRYNCVRLVKPATAEISAMGLPESSSCIRLVKPLTADMSDMEFLPKP